MDDLAPGSHLISQRHRVGLPLYTHHGIYSGHGIVIHYAGGSDDPHGDGSKVQTTTLHDFSLGQEFGVVSHPSAVFTNAEIVERAQSRIGEDGYSLFANNCEHFCHWAIYGDHASPQLDGGAILTSMATLVPGRIGTVILTGVGAASGLSGGAAMMKGLAAAGTVLGGAIGGIATAGVGLGLATAVTVNKTLLASSDNHSEDEAVSRKIGRTASIASVAGTTAATVAAVSAAGAVPGLSAAGITSGLAAIGGTVGGGMAAGMAMSVAAPAAVAVGLGYGVYKVAQQNDTFRDGLMTAGEGVSKAAEHGAEAAKRVAEVVGPVAQKVAIHATKTVRRSLTDLSELANDKAPVIGAAVAKSMQTANTGLRSILRAVENGAAQLRQRLKEGD